MPRTETPNVPVPRRRRRPPSSRRRRPAGRRRPRVVYRGAAPRARRRNLVARAKARTSAATASSRPTCRRRRARWAASSGKRGGGIFEITRMDYDDGEFRFFGWHKDAAAGLPQVIEVRLGKQQRHAHRDGAQDDRAHPRDRERRLQLGLVPARPACVVLSARPEDNSGLEEFMMHEFFDNLAPGARRVSAGRFRMPRRECSIAHAQMTHFTARSDRALPQ